MRFLLLLALLATVAPEVGVAALPHGVDLSWSALVPKPKLYKVYRGGGNCPVIPGNSRTTTALRVTDGNVIAGKKYSYIVSAVGQNNQEGPPSSCITVTIPTP